MQVRIEFQIRALCIAADAAAAVLLLLKVARVS
jgi:hypothetical protein